jgi:hypothetical protein
MDLGYYKNHVSMMEAGATCMFRTRNTHTHNLTMHLSTCLSPQNDITEAFPDLTFAAESDFFGCKELQELVPGGKDIRVTEANKRQYVDLIAHHHMTTSIRDQINAFLAGFWELIPR